MKSGAKAVGSHLERESLGGKKRAIKRKRRASTRILIGGKKALIRQKTLDRSGKPKTRVVMKKRNPRKAVRIRSQKRTMQVIGLLNPRADEHFLPNVRCTILESASAKL